MPTLLTHPAVPLAVGITLGRKILPPRLLLVGMVAAMLPDLDVVGLQHGVAYAAAYGHRGVTHSLSIALVTALLLSLTYRRLKVNYTTACWFLFISIGSHGVLDAFTNGGLGIALAWPFSEQRYFAPWRVIEVSPLGVERFFSVRGWEVLQSEAVWVWLPLLVVAGVGGFIRRSLTPPPGPDPRGAPNQG
ncbi:MAG: metal-dependent hydrolase [Gammaproteobacteria bacterium]|nr:metal-dependent hydrolase [Gammaproteobacteria bacterium]